LEIERIKEKGKRELNNVGKAALDMLVAKGLRAQLKTGMILTGQLYVGLRFFPDAPPAQVDYSGKYPVLPTIPAPMEEITASLSQFLKKLEKLPLEQMGEEINKTLQNAQRLLAAEEIPEALRELKGSLEKIKEFSESLNTELVPKMAATLDAAKASIGQIEATLDGAEKMLDADSPVAAELKRALKELSAAARSVRATAEYLERHPDALIYGKGKPKR
jgi:paraquat-inducible protein B